MTRIFTNAGLAAAALACLVNTASAQSYPERDITFVVHSSAGGGSDIFARVVGQQLLEQGLIPRPMIIENRPGGSGAVAYSYIASHVGEPYFMGTASGNFFTTPLLGESPVDYTDFTGIGALAQDPYIMAVRADSDITSLDDVAARETLVVGSTGIATDPRFLSQMLENALGVEMRVVPFDGDGEVIAALLGGHIDVQFGNPSEILPQIEAGAMRPIAVTAAERLALLPDVPTFTELGHDIQLAAMRGLVMPTDTPADVLAFWDDALSKLAASEAFQTEYVERFNLVPAYMNGAEYTAYMEATSNMYESLMRELEIIE
jgi:putative tricarboxylic transport membrane protein